MATNLKLVKIEAAVKKDLDSLKYYANESYTSVIKRLVEENKQLQEDKKQLYKIILAAEDSATLTDNVHKATYFIFGVVEDVSADEDEKLEVLVTYLKVMITEDPTSVLTAINILKDVFSGSGLLVKFENYVKTSF